LSVPRVDPDIRITPSVIDRLLDDGSGPRREEPHSVGELKRVVGRDLEALLNTRREILDDLPGGFAETGRSLLVYGLPDFSALNLASTQDRSQVRRALENVIATFEPRLDRVRVSMEEPRPFDRGLHFRIDAVLQVEPAPEPVTFDAVLQLTTQQYAVEGAA
jgi:type VI secretion system protein ImpF